MVDFPGRSSPRRFHTPIKDLEIEDFPGFAGRRSKAALTLSVLWGLTVVLHLVSWGSWAVLGLTAILTTHALRILWGRPLLPPPPLPSITQEVSHGGDAMVEGRSAAIAGSPWDAWPYVSLLVAAKNEETVIEPLVAALCQLEYPACRYEVWIIDDNSTDGTHQRLQKLTTRYPQLRILRRPAGSSGGKSGALNQVWPNTKGDIIGVFDADARVPKDLLRHLVPLFDQAEVGAVQLQKAVVNRAKNLWTRGQQAEMALDSYFQQQRISLGGIGELRGNGQFVRRAALAQCGGWNEETITDDLDLTLRLHFSGWEIQFLLHPAVGEEGVERPLALWHQRNRWAEGGYQRYLDYWRLITQRRLPPAKTFDMAAFWMIQYGLPAVALPDFAMAMLRHRLPLFLPVSSLALTLSMVGMFCGLRRIRQQPIWVSGLQTLWGNLYMLHWLLVIATMTMRLSVRPKRLRWVKTIHLGSEDDLQVDLP
ncbi:glycosyltransferase family 2 protein [Nodosilinea sp. FACHB-13]|uniref:glycosyltransferase n=1 Tax=Cyanophyceae TaxID=3028117 RepID=UPI001686583C|nr:glycosyltransferase family 2 protein [Nodosilinea sp. FACHB-13]MBD2105449.1 glycosyltransferase family 2 protein [Nodosilinea sp. FACHB-13]